MSGVVSLRVFTGTDAATMSTAQSTVALCADDALTGDVVEPGTVSFERWVALRVDTAPAVGFANFSIANTGVLPTGVSLKFGITDTPRTPVDTVSDIATMDLTSGRKFIFDAGPYNEAEDLTKYVVIQEVVAMGAPSGAISPQSLRFGFDES